MYLPPYKIREFQKYSKIWLGSRFPQGADLQ
jgi:hypothetical protein